MSCLVRTVKKDSYATFGETNVRCYYTFRCDKIATETGKCAFHNTRKIRSVVQFQSTYDHGLVSGPIYDHSHIYGGAWYNKAIERHGAIAVDDLRTVLAYHEEAHKENKIDKMIEMPRKSKVINGSILEVEESTIALRLPSAEEPKEAPKEAPKRRRPKIVLSEAPEAPKAQEAPEAPKEKLKRKPSKKAAQVTQVTQVSATPQVFATQVSSQVSQVSQVSPPIEKEVVIPTFIEDTLEETEYEIEFVKLTLFQLGDTTYFRDEKKNKLYHANGKKIGNYAGKLYNDSIHNEPDSDEE
jgi:hypothetical protein